MLPFKRCNTAKPRHVFFATIVTDLIKQFFQSRLLVMLEGSQLGATRLVSYLSSYIQRALVKKLLMNLHHSHSTPLNVSFWQGKVMVLGELFYTLYPLVREK